MVLQYLGTAAAEGWPGLFCRCPRCEQAAERGGKNLRTRSQAVIDGRLLIDFPPDSYLHMIRDGLDLSNIHSVLFTHSHQDHFYPSDLILRCGCYAIGLDSAINLYGNDTVRRLFENEIEASPDRKELRQSLHVLEARPFSPFQTEGYTVTPLRALHDRNETCLIYIVEKDGRRLLYGNDTGLFPEDTWAAIAGTRFDLISLDCTTGRYKEGTNHMGLPDNLEARERLIRIGCADEETRFVLNHFSHNGGLLHEELEEQAGAHGFLVSYDGMKIDV